MGQKQGQEESKSDSKPAEKVFFALIKLDKETLAQE
jgi:hypothetical protein